jgi:hypothetical protein
MDDRDDVPNDAVPEHDAPETDSERHQARAFGKLIEGLVAGEAPPPAIDADQRELLDVASTMRASLGEVELEGVRRDAIIDAAFARVLGTRSGARAPVADVTPLHGGGRSRLRYLPWATTVIAAAAAVALWIGRPAPSVPPAARASIHTPSLVDQHLSRPADLLIGKIERGDADQASARIDIIVADRMAGYRDLRLRGLVGSNGPGGTSGATQGGVR